MVGEDRVMMSGKELRRLHVVRQAMEQHITQVQAGTLLGLTDRHVRRLIQRVRQEGGRGFGHWGRGQPSNRRVGAPFKGEIPPLYAPRDGGFWPAFAAEELAERARLV